MNPRPHPYLHAPMHCGRPDQVRQPHRGPIAAPCGSGVSSPANSTHRKTRPIGRLSFDRSHAQPDGQLQGDRLHTVLPPDGGNKHILKNATEQKLS